jgi:hypothetical protein
MKDPILDPELELYFRSVADVPARTPACAEQGKRAFLDEARPAKPAVSKIRDSRLKERATFGKERIAMWKIAGGLLLGVGMLFGGGGAVVAGAQEAMPEDALYPVKTWSEDVRLWAAGDGLPEMDLALQFADRRAEELLHAAEAGLPIEDAVLLRLMDQDDRAFSIAAQTGDAEAPVALEKVRTRLEEHVRVLDYLPPGTGPGESAILLQTRRNIRQRLELLSGDLNDPQVRARILEQVRDRENPPDVTPAGRTNQNGNADAGQGAGGGAATPQGAGPQADGTPAPGSGNGAGDGSGPIADCECQTTCGGQGTTGSGNGAGGNSTCDCPTGVCTPQKNGQNGGGNK